LHAFALQSLLLVVYCPIHFSQPPESNARQQDEIRKQQGCQGWGAIDEIVKGARRRAAKIRRSVIVKAEHTDSRLHKHHERANEQITTVNLHQDWHQQLPTKPPGARRGPDDNSDEHAPESHITPLWNAGKSNSGGSRTEIVPLRFGQSVFRKQTVKRATAYAERLGRFHLVAVRLLKRCLNGPALGGKQIEWIGRRGRGFTGPLHDIGKVVDRDEIVLGEDLRTLQDVG
jgi:hypothetical protein